MSGLKPDKRAGAWTNYSYYLRVGDPSPDTDNQNPLRMGFVQTGCSDLLTYMADRLLRLAHVDGRQAAQTCSPRWQTGCSDLLTHMVDRLLRLAHLDGRKDAQTCSSRWQTGCSDLLM
ncbi:hypothetical protein RRG08_064871 [Elysia crispata]|uniref:Uncharacterized protein n=1 Tax=Elysia crispata TaxID=231223 RepID=A0AAE0XMV5_9GAST|nr:hypothetical protein RRG08_064871 [Elysia crispata]